MSFYIRKSVKAGPFRFNLSRSGIGVSAGVPGFRVGTGPRGNYVHMGRHGVYYRSSLPSTRSKTPSAHGRSPVGQPPLSASDVVLEDVTGATTVELAASDSTQFLQQLNDAARRTPVTPAVALVGGLLAVVLLGAVPILGIAAVALVVAVAWWTHQWDQARRSVVAFYDVTDVAGARYQELVNHFAAASSTKRAWHVLAAGAVTTTYQYKTNAGASSVLRRIPAALSTKGPPVLVTNIVVPTIESKQRGLYFLPDRVLVRDGKSFAEAPYADISVRSAPTRFIEDGAVPGDSRNVGSTWKYVNVKGGPDRRYKNNRQLPIMEYGELEIGDLKGLHAVLQFSRRDSADHLAGGMVTMAANSG